MTQITPLQQVFNQADELNKLDPNQILFEGQEVAKEWLYSQRMQAQLKSFLPDASALLQIAAYCQHIERWKIARSDYPMDRSGYKRWRTELGKFHADTTASLMKPAGYDDASIERVQYLLQKKGLKRDPETQALEDVICLVFIDHYLEDFATAHSKEKLIDIIRKTWNKMSEQGHAAALKLDIPPPLGELISEALN